LFCMFVSFWFLLSVCLSVHGRALLCLYVSLCLSTILFPCGDFCVLIIVMSVYPSYFLSFVLSLQP
jgi:hypothetical protein